MRVIAAEAMRKSRIAPFEQRRPNRFTLDWQDTIFSTNRSVPAVPVQLHDTPLLCAVETAVRLVPFCVNTMVSRAVVPTVACSAPSRHSPPVMLVLVSVNVQIPATGTGVGAGLVGVLGLLSLPHPARQVARPMTMTKRCIGRASCNG